MRQQSELILETSCYRTTPMDYGTTTPRMRFYLFYLFSNV